MINKPYLTMKHIIPEIIALVLAVLNLVFVIIFINITHTDLLAEIQSEGYDCFGSLAALLVMAIIFILGTMTGIAANHFMPSGLYRLPFKVNPEKYNEVMYFVTLGTAVNLLEISMWVCFFSVIWALRVGPLQVPSVILLLVIAIPTSLIFTALAYRHNK